MSDPVTLSDHRIDIPALLPEIVYYNMSQVMLKEKLIIMDTSDAVEMVVFQHDINME